jgi:hypothetical protein
MSRIIPDELGEHALAEAVSLFGLDANSVRLIEFSQNYVYTAQGPQGKESFESQPDVIPSGRN